MAEEPDNVVPLRFAIEEAEEVPAPRASAGRPGRVTARPGQGDNRATPRGEPNSLYTRGNEGVPPEGPAQLLPEGCPIEPLGVLGDTFYYLDDLRQLRDLPAREHSRLGVLALFGRKNYLLEHYWPRVSKDGQVSGWRPEMASEHLMSAAAMQGVWDPFDRVRGRGAWLGADGGLILHCGDLIYDGKSWNEPGRIGRHVYPAGSPIMQPAMAAKLQGAGSAGQQLLDLFATWRWRRKNLDARLLLGWCCAAMLGGAIDWRPLVWITGGRGTGKSTLHKLIGRLFGGALVQVSDATAASLWQKLGHSTLPVTFDELEAEKDGKRAQNVIKFARQAASGGLVLRGGADHNAAEFMARSCMMFSSILIPPLLSQDRSRMAILELDELGAEKPPAIDEDTMGKLGAELLRRLVDGWARYGDTLETFRDALATNGHSARGADVFGTLLAMADLALEDHELDGDSASELAAQLSPLGLAEADDDISDQERCLQHLMSTAIPRDGGGTRASVASWIERAASDDDEADWKTANRMLGMYGMKVQREGRLKNFAVANYHVELAKIFDGSHWEGQSGSMGVWVQALRRLPGAERSKVNVRTGAVAGKCTVVPIQFVVTQPDADEARAAVDMGGIFNGR